jgi:UDP-N-acetylglucosamine acyltransferase
MSQIHPTAIVGKNVQLGKDNVLGPHVILEDGVKLGDRNTLLAGAYVCQGTEIGSGNKIHMQAVIGHEPQDVAFKNEATFTKIGDNNTIREFVTIHRGTKGGTSTVIGNSNYLMAYCHVAHNCVLGDHIIMVNNASLTGYITVEDRAFLSGMTGFHQFTRIGTLAMVSALSACNKDIPPYMIVGGRPGIVLGINVVGLRRAGMNAAVREEIKSAYKLLYRSGMNVSQAVEEMKKSFQSAEVQHLVRFIEESKRGIVDGSAAETLNPRKTGFLDSSEDED